jgi:lipopolysaccharide biosynthesis glycosyltransferase
VTTVTDAVYLPGTIVLLSSFLAHNPWFTGDIVVIHDGLSEHDRKRLARFPNLRFHPVGAELKARLAAVTAASPLLARKRPNLLSLEVFALAEYDRVLKCDSDILCVGSVAALMDMDGALFCCPDQSYFKDQVRDLQTYAALDRTSASSSNASDALSVTFNVGVLMISPGRLGPSTYADLVASVQPAAWSDVRTPHSDSVVLNRYFRGAWTQVSNKFNYLILNDTSRHTQAGVRIEDAAMLHFLGRPKPWEPQADATADSMDADRRTAIQLWRNAWKSAFKTSP